jgi:hypothetical protein
MRGLDRSGLAAARAFANPSFGASVPGQPVDGMQRWGIVLVAFMRLLALAWVVQGLLQWTAALVPRDSPLDQATVQWGVGVVAFAALDPVAAVALWLAKPWGGVIWLFAAVSQIAAAIVIPGFFSPLWIWVDGLLIGLYFLLTWLATRAPRRRRDHD